VLNIQFAAGLEDHGLLNTVAAPAFAEVKTAVPNSRADKMDQWFFMKSLPENVAS
jgi:hypothetical protein